MAGLSDGDVDALRSHDPAAFRTVYETLAPLVLGYTRAKGAADPEAMTQDVFLAVFRNAHKVSGGVNGLRTFIFSVAHARLVDEYRQRSRRPEDLPFEATQDPRQAPDAEAAALDRVSRAQVLGLLAELPDGQREAVALRFVAELSLEETAEVLGRSVGAVKQLQRRGLLALRERAIERGVTP